MGNVPVEKKLQLVKMIRSEHQNNRMVMKSREEFLYGKSRGYHEDGNPLYALEEDAAQSAQPVFSSFWLRFLIAAVLMAAFVMWDNSKEEFLGRRPEEVYILMEDNAILPKLFDFMEDITYTLESAPAAGQTEEKD